jgi:hypothetical protein
MSSKWGKLIEKTERLKSKILEDEKYAPTEKSINFAIKVLKRVEKRLDDVENPKLYEVERHGLTKKGIQMVKGKRPFARAVRQLYKKHGTGYLAGRKMSEEVGGEGKIYAYWDIFETPRRSAFKEGVFERIRKGQGYIWRISPTVVKYLE